MGDSDTRDAGRSIRRKRRRRRNKNRVKEQGVHVSASNEPYEELSVDDVFAQVQAFELFGAYYLGLTKDERYRLARGRDVARRFCTTQDVIGALLRHYGIEDGAVQSSGFELDLARLDMEKVPEGISRREVARQLYEEYCDLAGLSPGAAVVAWDVLRSQLSETAAAQAPLVEPQAAEHSLADGEA